MHNFNFNSMRQEKFKNFLTQIGLIGFMAGLYYHTYSFFSVFFDSWLIGHAVALAIDASTYAAVFRRKEMQLSGEIGVTSWAIFALCLITSLFTNMHESYVSNYGSSAEFTVASIKGLDIMQLMKLGIGSFIPPIIMFLSLFLASSVSHTEVADSQHPFQKKGLTVIKNNKEQRKNELKKYLLQNPDATKPEMMNVIGVKSVDTVNTYLDEIASEQSNGYHAPAQTNGYYS